MLGLLWMAILFSAMFEQPPDPDELPRTLRKPARHSEPEIRELIEQRRSANIRGTAA